MCPSGKARNWTWRVAVLLPLVAGCAGHGVADQSPLPRGVAPLSTEADLAQSPESSAVVPVAYLDEPAEGAEAAKKDMAETLPAPLPLDEKESPSVGLTLDQIINATLLSDPQLRAGFESINQAQAEALTASLRPNPTLTSDIQLLPLTRPFTEEAQGGPPQMDHIVGYPIDWLLFGKRAAAMASASLGIQVSEAEYADRIRRRVTEAAVAYYDVLEARALVALTRQNVANLERIEAITRKAVEAGGRPQVELSRVRLDLLQNRQELRNAQAELVKTKAALQAIIGRADADPDFDVAGALEGPLAAAPLPLEEAYAIAVAHRPDLHAARWKMAQAQAEVVVERRKAYPEVKTELGFTRQFQTKAIGQPNANSWLAAVETSLPFFDRNQGNRAKAASLLAQAHYEWQGALVELRAELETGTVELRTALANAESVAGDQLRLAGEVRDSLNKAYAAGGRPLLDVLDAQRNYRETYRLFIESRANLGRAGARYSAILGKQVAP